MPLMQFGGFVVAAADAAGAIWFADSREYRVFRRSLEGDTTLVFELPEEPEPTGESERDFIRQRFAERPEIMKGQLEALPDTKPVLYGIVPDNAGHVYVFPELAGEPGGTIVDVFKDTGVYLGRMELPEAVAVANYGPPTVHVTEDYVYAAVKDEVDVPYVARFRIAKSR